MLSKTTFDAAGDPVEITIRGYELTLRKAEAACVEMQNGKEE